MHVFALHQEPKPGQWPLLGATVHNIGRRPVTPRTLLTMMSEHRKAPFDVVHAYWASGPGVIAAAFRTLTGTPAALTLPGGDLCAFDDIEYGGLRTFAGRLRVRVAIAGENVVIAQSGPIRREAAELGIASQVLPFGVALNHWPVRQPAARVPGSALRLVHVADLNRIKDPETLLLALAHLHERGVEFHLDQLGLDTLGGSVRRRADHLELGDRISFHGHCSRRKVRSLIERADLMLVSSRHEGGPVVALEAAVAGVPTVGTRVGQVADWAPEAALAVEVGDSDGLADAVQYLALNEERRLRIARAAQARAVRDDADATVAGLMAIYSRLLANEAKQTPAASAV